MAKRVFVWLTDDEHKEYQRVAEELGIEYTQLGTLLICKWLNLEPVPKKRKKRDEWIQEHEARTRDEFKTKGSGTANRVEQFMRESDQAVWSTSEIRDRLGWKQTGGLGQELAANDKFKEVSRPADRARQRGAQPKYWTLSSPSSSE